MLSLEGHVVLVDDDNSIRAALARMLRWHGYTPSTFISAEDLLDTHTVVNAACMILDIQLPGLTGFELYDYVARMRAPPVIFMTGYDEPGTRPRAEAAGAAAYLVKPFSGRELVAATARAIKAGRARDPG